MLERIEIIKAFYTPKSMQELEDQVSQLCGNERAIATLYSTQMYNLMATQMNHLIDTINNQNQSSVLTDTNEDTNHE